LGVHFHIPPEERRVVPWIAGLILLAFFAALFPIPKALLWDEAVYLSTAENLGKAAPYYSEISHRPPLLPLLLRLGGSVMRIDTFGHLLSAAFFAAGVLVMYLLGRRLFNRTAGLISAVLMAACPFLLHFSHKVMTDVPAAVLAAASMLCFFELAGEEDEEPRRITAIAAGVLLAAAVLMRFVLGTLFVVPVYLVLLNRVAFRPVLIAAGSALATLAPYLLWAQIRQGGAWKPFAAAMFGEGGSEKVADPLYYFVALFMIAGPVVLAGIAFYLAPGMGRRRGDNVGRDIPLLLWFGVLFVCLSLSQQQETRYLIPAVPVLFLYAGAGYARCTRRRVAIAATAIALIACGYQVAHLQYFRGMQELGEPQLLAYSERTREAADFLRPQLHATDVVYTSSLYPIVAWYSKANTVALWPWTDEFYAEYPKNMKRDGYLVFYKGFGKEPNQDWLDHRLEFRMVKEFPDVTIYAYSIPVLLRSEPESAEGADRVGAERPAGARNR
jgi:Dolichyl-phosphate-mannose-protein mannosyltransferase/Alg9-like mannosyltransferase family